MRLLAPLVQWLSRCLLNVLLRQRYVFFLYRHLFCGEFKSKVDKMVVWYGRSNDTKGRRNDVIDNSKKMMRKDEEVMR